MPTLTRWFIKTALLHFVVALSIGAARYSDVLTTRLPTLAVIWPVYLHLLMVGWITGLIIGVAYWLFPRSDRSRPAPSARLGWVSYIFLNTGLLLRIVAEPAAMLDRLTPLRWMLPLSGMLQLGAACAFVVLIWPRVKER